MSMIMVSLLLRNDPVELVTDDAVTDDAVMDDAAIAC